MADPNKEETTDALIPTLVDGSGEVPTDNIQTPPDGPTGFLLLGLIPTRPPFRVVQQPLVDNTSTKLANTLATLPI
jgi:hypothetical protein